ncbi:hypothetical protein SBA5_290042 [Candidatus Sulfotelmatomonas gaucii]|uniref:Uncharacterized protein n=1 Tax=Candidatus Sulfuritelmatomonas gaucii TaxID=2043161 RepID=A0A2N9LA93_9BACT|nr:hypothetical protein SBA5_290042 [Candidatus Sulfotelmatomonas gaucii]
MILSCAAWAARTDRAWIRLWVYGKNKAEDRELLVTVIKRPWQEYISNSAQLFGSARG